MRWMNPRQHDDEGAVAVIVALAMVALLGATALAVDVGMLYNERAQLQNGADAAALAVAQACATSPTGTACTSPASKVQSLANANTLAGSADVRSITVSGGTARVTVAKTMPTAFAAALGFSRNTVSASATAAWGTPVSGPAVLPIAFATCTFTSKPLGTPMILLATVIGDTSCRAANGMALPGGFGWLKDPSAICNLTATTGQWLPSDTGASANGACKTRLHSLLNTTVILPVYDSTTGTGTNGTYHLAGWAGFKLLGWRFPSDSQPDAADGLTIRSSDTGLIGKFLGFTTLDKRFTLGTPTPPYASVVALTR
jgi:Flp pilus assembly protein TadG